MAQFVRRQLVVEARQVCKKCFVEERGQKLPVHPGDWLVTDKRDTTGKSHVLSDEEFRADYHPVGGWPKLTYRIARYRKKRIIVGAIQVTEPGFIEERGKTIPLQRFDWVVNKGSAPSYCLRDQDFRRVYRPLDSEAKRAWDAHLTAI